MDPERPVPSLRERRQRRTREDIVDGVLAVIAAGGLGEATIDRVAQASGVARGTVYAHFPGGRDELLRAAYARIGHDLVAKSRDALAHADGWASRIDALAVAMLDVASDARVGHFYNVTGPALVTGTAEQGIGSGASVEMIRETLEEAQRAGAVPLVHDTEATAVLLVGALRDAAVGVAAGRITAGSARSAFSRLVAGLAEG